MLDFHSHILPGIDDGSKDLETTEKMLALLKKQGVTRLGATSHFYYDEVSYKEFLVRRNKAANLVFENINPLLRPKIVLGAEVSFFNGIELFEGIESLCFEGTDYMLLELPFRKWDQRIYSALSSLKRCRDITPVIAHVERYAAFNPLLESVEKLIESGCLIQCNTSFFTKPIVRLKALRMMKKGYVQFIGTDCHNLDRRKPNYDEATRIIERKLGDSAIENLEFWEHNFCSKGAVFR